TPEVPLARIHDAGTRAEPEFTATRGRPHIAAAAFSPDGRFVVTLDDQSVTLSQDRPEGHAFTARSIWTTRVWDAATGALRHSFLDATWRPEPSPFSSDGRRI